VRDFDVIDPDGNQLTWDHPTQRIDVGFTLDVAAVLL
jgi:hypothetical protein